MATILIVDDSPTIRASLAYGAKMLRHTVIEATDGEAAWARVLAGGIDLIISDWNMPKLNGLDFVRRLRLRPHLRALPVILATSETDRARCLAAGANDYLQKPVNPRELMGLISKHLADKAA